VDEIYGGNAWRIKVYKGMFNPWNPMKEDIERWLKINELDFV
jgi:hypothetical protein